MKGKKIEKHCLNIFVFYIDNIIYYVMNSLFLTFILFLYFIPLQTV